MVKKYMRGKKVKVKPKSEKNQELKKDEKIKKKRSDDKRRPEHEGDYKEMTGGSDESEKEKDRSK